MSGCLSPSCAATSRMPTLTKLAQRRAAAPAAGGLARPPMRHLGGLGRRQRQRSWQQRTAAQPDSDEQQQQQQQGDGQDAEGLAKDEDWTVPGGYEDSLSSNTPLGRAVREACDELEHLGQLESDVLSEAADLLAKLGVKKDVLQPNSPPQPQQGEDEE